MKKTWSCCRRAVSDDLCVGRAQSPRKRTITRRRRDLSPSLLLNAPPVESLVSGSGQMFDPERARLWPLLALPERSYKKSKKHKKKTKKRRHKSVSAQVWRSTGVFGRDWRSCDHQASPDSDNEKKGRERDGKREKDLEKEKENDKSRGKSRSESKQKSPKRKAAKEEVSCPEDWALLPFSTAVFRLLKLLRVAFRVAGIRQAASWVKES